MKYTVSAVALIASAGAAFAGGIERSDQSVAAIFEKGNYIELSYAHVTPSVDGVYAGVAQSGNMAETYGRFGGALKFDINEKLSFAFIAENPYGASVSYNKVGYPLQGTKAHISALGMTALARYKLNDNFSVHGGFSYMSADASVTLAQGGVPLYLAELESTSGFGYVVGAAYERPEIAMRAALTYRSAIEMEHDVKVGGAVNIPKGTTYKLPQSVTLDVQTGIAANTLLMGKVRWVDWSAMDVYGPNPMDPSNPVRLIDYSQDTISYSVGVGRQFSEKFSGSIMVGYERSTGRLASNLYPTDGNYSISVGAKYQATETSAISIGASYIKAGDAKTMGLGADFKDNSAFAVGVKYSFNF